MAPIRSTLAQFHTRLLKTPSKGCNTCIIFPGRSIFSRPFLNVNLREAYSGATRSYACSRKDSRKEALTWGSAPKCPTRLNQVRLGQCIRTRQCDLETVRRRDDC